MVNGVYSLVRIHGVYKNIKGVFPDANYMLYNFSNLLETDLLASHMSSAKSHNRRVEVFFSNHPTVPGMQVYKSAWKTFNKDAFCAENVFCNDARVLKDVNALQDYIKSQKAFFTCEGEGLFDTLCPQNRWWGETVSY
jgi:hypothetical protein